MPGGCLGISETSTVGEYSEECTSQLGRCSTLQSTEAALMAYHMPHSYFEYDMHMKTI